jgi:apolipoprotein N-acyltransferase
MNTSAVLPPQLRYFLLPLSGVMLGLAFPPFTTGVLAAFAFIPLFIVFEEIQSLGKAFRYSYLTFSIFNLLCLWWVGGFVHGEDFYMMVAGAVLVLAHPLFMVVPIIAFTFMHKHLGYSIAILSFPFLWVTFEYLHSITQLAFPWLVLGNTQTYDATAIQFASYTGVYGISFWLLWMNVLGFFLYKKLATRTWKPLSVQSVLLAVCIVVVYLIPKTYGSIILERAKIEVDIVLQDAVGIVGLPRRVTVGIVQPNIDPFEKWQTHAEKQLAVLQDMTNEFTNREVDLIVWPETALPFFILAPQHHHVFKRIREQIDTLGVSLFTGIPDFVYYPSPETAPKSSRVNKATGQRYDYFNSSMLLQPHNTEIQKYAKMILVPFSERVPYAGLFTFLQTLQWDFGLGGWQIGSDTTVFRLQLRNGAQVWFSNLICYESIYPGFVAEFVRRGAQFLTIITNDSWWGDTFGPYQHQQYAVLRAVENRRWIVRCANGGISCLIDPYGKVIQSAPMFVQTNLIGEIKTRGNLTFYSKYGDIFSQLCFLVSGFLVTTTFGKMFYKSYRVNQ